MTDYRGKGGDRNCEPKTSFKYNDPAKHENRKSSQISRNVYSTISEVNKSTFMSKLSQNRVPFRTHGCPAGKIQLQSSCALGAINGWRGDRSSLLSYSFHASYVLLLFVVLLTWGSDFPGVF